MSTATLPALHSHFSLPAIRKVDSARPFRWLFLGAHDLLTTWPISLGLGVLFTAGGLFLVDWAWIRPHLAMALTSGFLLVAPFLALGFYVLSRHIEHRHRRVWLSALTGVRRNASSIGLYALMLAFVLSVWERVSAILVGLFLYKGVTENGYFSFSMLFSPEHVGFDIAYLLFGAILAVGIFILSVVTLPMLLDRRVDTVTAIMTSILAVRENPLPLLIWAAIIVVLGVIGIASGLYAFALIFPLLGHATWHAYREMVRRT